MPTGIKQLGRENSDGAIVGGKRLVQLGHLAPDAGKTLHKLHLEAHFGQIQSGLYPGDSTADY
jgi:hypothetical protein